MQFVEMLDILWDASQIIVTSPKTEHHKGHETRVIPVFPELASVLSEAYEAAFELLNDEHPETVATVNGPIVTRYRSASQNLRTTFTKIIEWAGLKAWPRPFQNLRSTRETELMETFPAHVVCGWIGNSEAVARKHYLQITDAHFKNASAEKVAHPVAQSDCVPERTSEVEAERA